MLLSLFPGFPRSLLEWGSLPTTLCLSLLSLDVAETSPYRNGERRFMMLVVCPDLGLRNKISPISMLVVTPVGSAPRPDVSLLYNRAALWVIGAGQVYDIQPHELLRIVKTLYRWLRGDLRPFGPRVYLTPAILPRNGSIRIRSWIGATASIEGL